MAVAKRVIDAVNRTITLEFSNGATYGPIELNDTTDVLTKMIGLMMEKILTLEAKTANLPPGIR
jgi:hypothetical protein